jgi:hypothetical protein
MAGKGSRARPLSVSKSQFDDNWDKIFGKKEEPKTEIISNSHGRPRLKLLNLAQAKTALEKAGRGRDKNKIRNRIVLLENRAKKIGVLDLVTTTTNHAELV